MQPPFQPQQKHAPGIPQDLGFLLLVLFSIADLVLWELVDFLEMDYDQPLLRIYPHLFRIAYWLVIILFMRNKTYRIIAIVCGALFIGWFLWKDLRIERVEPIHLQF